MMTALALALLSLLAAGLDRSPASDLVRSPDPSPCRVGRTLVRLSDVPEASGIAASRTSDFVWVLNDSGQPVLFTLDPNGSEIGRVRIEGATVEDWEALAAGPCDGGSCLYAGDIGDNDARREQIAVYRFAEPAEASATVKVDAVFHATYPDGPQDAEALLVTGSGMFVITKGSTGPIALYRFPREVRPGASVQLERVGEPHTQGKVDRDEWITDASISPSGEWVALRTHRSITLYPAARFVAGDWRNGRVIGLGDLGEAQGEGVALGDRGVVYLVGEGGGKSAPGTFARLTCALGRK